MCITYIYHVIYTNIYIYIKYIHILFFKYPGITIISQVSVPLMYILENLEEFCVSGRTGDLGALCMIDWYFRDIS